MDSIRNRESQIVVVRPPTPWTTVAIVTLCLVIFYVSQTSGVQWLKANGFSPEKYFEQTTMLNALTYMGMPNFCLYDVWHFIGSIYFIWVFGSTIEQRLGSALTLIVTVFATITGWYTLAHVNGALSLPLFIGPTILTCGLLGGYIVLMPEKKVSPAGAVPKYSYRIYKREPEHDPSEKYGVSPWLIVTMFVVFTVIMQFYIQTSNSSFSVVQPIPALAAIFSGLLLTIALVVLTTQHLEANPMKGLARLKYKELRSLDMTHEQAVKGTARVLGVTSEKIEEWLGTGKQL